jgi:hypothetical protein
MICDICKQGYDPTLTSYLIENALVCGSCFLIQKAPLFAKKK